MAKDFDLSNLHNWITILDEFALWGGGISYYYINLSFEDNQYLFVRKTLLSAIVADMVCIRKVILSGFDTHARILLRSFSETVDIFTLCLISDELCLEFQKSQTYEQTNDFWHKHISKGKAKINIRTKIRDRLSKLDIDQSDSEEILSGLNSYFDDEDKMMGSVVHPSFLSSVMKAGNGLTYDKGGHGMFGMVDEASIRCCQFIFLKLFYHVSLFHPEVRAILPKKSLYDHDQSESDPILELVNRRTDFVFALLRHFFTKTEDPSLRYRWS